MKRIQKITFLVSLAVVAAYAALAATEEPSLTYDAPFPGSDTGRIYYFVPKGLDLSKPAPLLVFMHGGNRKSPDNSPEKYLDLKTGTMMPTLYDAPFIVAAPSAPPAAADAPKIPKIDVGKCIGCGACEHFCPARPKAAMVVEGRC